MIIPPFFLQKYLGCNRPFAPPYILELASHVFIKNFVEILTVIDSYRSVWRELTCLL